MKPLHLKRKAQSGSSMIEVLVTLVILMLGLLGLVGLMLQSQRSQQESYQRVQAVVLMDDMVNRISANPKAVSCYVITNNANGTPFLGTNTTITTPTCTAAGATAGQQARAVADMSDWSNLLKGMTEKDASNNNVGAMLGARGCVESVSVGVYRVSVVWQGNSQTFAPFAEVACGSGLYGAEAQRRAVSVNLTIS
jgi:type IV pilus assembly protein PilV